MSFSMLLGRVFLPACGLAIATVVIWQFASTGRVDFSAISLRSGRPGESASPAPTRSVATEEAAKIVAEGRVVAYPGAQVVVGSPVAGTISRVMIQEKSVVHKGDLLVEFKSKDVAAQLAEAKARLAEAELEISRSESEDARQEKLIAKKAATRQDYERGHYSLLGLRIRRDALRAMCDRLEALLDKYRILAPIDGVVTSRFGQPGETVNVAAPLVTIVDLSRLRIEAEVDEYDVANAALESAVKISAEGYPNQSWPGRIEELSDVLVGRRIRPEDPGRPTDTRVLPVRIAFRSPTPLKFGQRVEVEITGKPAGRSESQITRQDPSEHAPERQ